MITTLLFLDGYKTHGHTLLIQYLKERRPVFGEYELRALDILRKRRDNIVYYGIFVDSPYLKGNKETFERIIAKLSPAISKRMR